MSSENHELSLNRHLNQIRAGFTIKKSLFPFALLLPSVSLIISTGPCMLCHLAVT